MADPKPKLKGILKKPKSSSSEPEPSSLVAELLESQTKAEQREIALQHATIIQAKKDLELQVIDAITTLSEFPSVRDPEKYSAAEPAPSDATTFRDLVRLFQPSDYDDLIEERNINGLCGYTLCPNPRRRYTGAGEFKLVNTGKEDFGVMKTADLEKWCSETCARRALYIKVQLQETAAWERVGIDDLKIDLLEEEKAAPGDTSALEKATALALERGDTDGMAPGRNITVAIREKTVTRAPETPQATQGQADHLMVEGHKAEITKKAKDEAEAAS